MNWDWRNIFLELEKVRIMQPRTSNPILENIASFFQNFKYTSLELCKKQTAYHCSQLFISPNDPKWANQLPAAFLIEMRRDLKYQVVYSKHKNIFTISISFWQIETVEQKKSSTQNRIRNIIAERKKRKASLVLWLEEGGRVFASELFRLFYSNGKWGSFQFNKIYLCSPAYRM